MKIFKRGLIVGFSTVLLLYDAMKRVAVAVIMKRITARYIILYYHDIPKAQQARFARQMDLLVKYSVPVSCEGRPLVEAGKRYAGITFDDGFISYKEIVLPELERRRLPSTVFIPTHFLGKAPGWLQYSAERLMTPDEIRNIAKDPLVTIGSHGVNHKPFGQMSADEAACEFVESKRVLEDLTGHNVTFFSFPHGDYSEYHLSLAQCAGYKRIFSILPYCAFKKDDEYITGRVKVDPTDWDIEFMLKIMGVYRWLPYAYRFKRILYRWINSPAKNVRKK